MFNKLVLFTIALVGSVASADVTVCKGYAGGQEYIALVWPSSAIKIYFNEALYGSVDSSTSRMIDEGQLTQISGSSGKSEIEIYMGTTEEADGVRNGEVSFTDDGTLRLKTNMDCTTLK